MDIFVNLLFINTEIETFKIKVDEKTTLTQAKELIREQSCVYPEEQVWFINNSPILKFKEIEWNNTSNYSIIVNNKWFTFNIKTMSGNNIEVKYLNSRDKISIIKYHIYEKIKLGPNSYKLIANTIKGAVELKDNEMIGRYFIPNNTTINLIISLNSGF